MADSLLRLENVTAGYGDAVVLHGISLDLPENGSLAVLGRNGVGKSTLLLTIMGYTQMRAGRLAWRGQAPGMSMRSLHSFRASPNAAATWATSCPEASSRCSRSRAR